MDKLPQSAGTREVVKRGRIAASRLGHDCLGPEHYLLGAIEVGEDAFAAQALVKAGVDPRELREAILQALPAGRETIGDVFSETPQARRMIAEARMIAEEARHDCLGSEHLLLGIVRAGGSIAARVLEQRGVTYEKLAAAVEEVIRENDPALRPDKKAAQWSGFRAEMNRRILRRGNDLTRAFFGLDKRVFNGGELDALSKELMGFACNLVLRCDDCAIYHMRRCRALGMTEGQFWEAINIGMVSGGAVVIPLARRLVALWDELEEDEPHRIDQSGESVS